MMRRDEPELLRHFVLKHLDRFRKKLDDPAALSADHVIMMVVVVVVFEIGLVVAKSDLPGQPRLGKQPKRPIDCRVPNRWVVLLDESMKVVERQMFLGAQKDIHDQLALDSPAKPGAFYVL